MLSRPDPCREAEPYWLAFVMLSRDRLHESISLGMAGGLTLPRPVPREAIRREGRRLAHRGTDLEDFVEIVMRVDDFYVEVAVKRAADDAKAAARSNKR